MATEKRLIDANALLRRLQKRREDFASGWRTFDSMPDGAKAKYEENLACSLIIEDFPTVDAAEVVHGQWEQQQGLYSCSECGKTCPYDVQAETIMYWTCNYCPNCGAKMDGGTKNETD